MPIPHYVVLTRYNDQVIEISELADGITGAYENAATVTATLYDNKNRVVPPISALTMSYVAASNGIYRGLVEDIFNAPVGANYVLEIMAVANTNVKNRWRIPCRVEDRTS